MEKRYCIRVHGADEAQLPPFSDRERDGGVLGSRRRDYTQKPVVDEVQQEQEEKQTRTGLI